MKKFVVLLVVVAMTCFSAMAFAADVTVGGSYEVRSRYFNNLTNGTAGTANTLDTQNRIRIDVNAKAGDVKGKLQLESDFGTGATDWGTGNDSLFAKGGSGYSTPGSNLGFREAWVNFNLPGVPVNVTAGHQLLALGQGWFFRSMHYGSDAWVVANQTGNNTIALVDVKVAEVVTTKEDDIDAYVLLDMFKINDNNTVGIDITRLADRSATISGTSLSTVAPPFTSIYGATNPFNKISLWNLGLNYTGTIGILKLKFEADQQVGTADGAPGVSTGTRFQGNQIVLQGAIPVNPVTINFTAARGSGNKPGSNQEQYVNSLDIDPHYTFLYEYKIAQPAANYLNGKASDAHLGFANTTAFSVGVSFDASKSVVLGADYWYLLATEQVADRTSTVPGATSNKIGQELDLKLNWKLYDNLAWNWTAGYFKRGDAMGSVDATGLQGILAFKF